MIHLQISMRTTTLERWYKTHKINLYFFTTYIYLCVSCITLFIYLYIYILVPFVVQKLNNTKKIIHETNSHFYFDKVSCVQSHAIYIILPSYKDHIMVNNLT